jgi:hypothetical protein
MGETRFIRLGGVFGDAFGNPVVEIEGPFADDFSNLPWVYTEHWSGTTARYRAAGYNLYVRDYDGDDAGWEVSRHGVKIASGYCREFYPALAECEKAMRAHIRAAIDANAAKLAANNDGKLADERYDG